MKGGLNGETFFLVRDPLDDERVAIDFAPLYQALHIHSVLGRLTEFETFYMDNRRVTRIYCITFLLSSVAPPFSHIGS